MKKKEFLDLLRQSLEGEVDRRIIEQSINFYNEYISSHPDKNEEEVINEIGDPRLIAKTIIDTEKISSMETDSQNDYSSYESRGNYDDFTGNHDSNRPYNKVYHLKWYHIAIIVFLVLFLFALLIRIGLIMIRLLYIFFVPIIIIGLLWTMFRRR